MKISPKTSTARQTVLSLLNVDSNSRLYEAIRLNLIRYYPPRLEIAMDEKLDSEYKALANGLDYIDFHYRRYVCGMHKTLHRVTYEIRQLQKRDLYNKQSVIEVIELIDAVLLDNEIYELMDRHKTGKKKVVDFLNQGNRPPAKIVKMYPHIS